MVWEPHALAGEPPPRLKLKMGQRCRAKTGVAGVPAGTTGVVTLTGGLAWLRYRVRFTNGVELGFLDGNDIEAA
ncbi:MAG: hypothetical protein ACRD0F_09835 [Acidimicrobiales bacterium]